MIGKNKSLRGRKRRTKGRGVRKNSMDIHGYPGGSMTQKMDILLESPIL